MFDGISATEDSAQKMSAVRVIDELLSSEHAWSAGGRRRPWRLSSTSKEGSNRKQGHRGMDVHLISCEDQAIVDKSPKPSVREQRIKLRRRLIWTGFSINLQIVVHSQSTRGNINHINYSGSG